MNPIKILLLCPVPEDQKPINQYISFNENRIVTWIKIKKIFFPRKYFSFLFAIFVFLYVLFLSLILVPKEILFFFNLLLKNSFFFLNFLFFLFLATFFNWLQLSKRLNSARFFYEEASWYDGQFWEKPFFIIKNDRLLNTQQIQPIQKKLQILLSIFFFLNIGFFSFYQIL
jgi:hypothetical protein